MDGAHAQALALRLITKNGRPVIFQRMSSTPADATKPWKGPGSPVVAQSVTTVAVTVPLQSAVDLGFESVDDELLKRTEQMLIVPGGAVDLTPFHALLDSGVRWGVEWVRTLKPASTIVLYAFGVKR